MRFLHTSDWHLGRQFHQSSLLDEQAAAIERIVEIALEESVDAVLIAGDLFDRAIPPTGAVELLDEALYRLRDTGASVVAVTGNHDSPSRAGFGDRLLSRAGVTLRSDPRRVHEPVVVTDERSGNGDNAVACYPIPYLDPLGALTAGGTDIDTGTDTGTDTDTDTDTDTGTDQTAPRRPRATHDSVLRSALRQVRSDVVRRGLPSVVVGHAFVSGTASGPDEAAPQECDSERPLSVGGADRVDRGAFCGVDLVALGHLHGRQSWEGGRIGYSGSPLAYSFSEQHHRKGVRILDLGERGAVSARHIDLGVGRGLCTITGTLDDLLSGSEHAPAESMRVRAVLRDVHLPASAMARLRQRFPHAAEVVHDPPASLRPSSRPSSGQVRRRQPLDLALDFLAEQWGVEGADVGDDVAALVRTGVAAVSGALG